MKKSPVNTHRGFFVSEERYRILFFRPFRLVWDTFFRKAYTYIDFLGKLDQVDDFKLNGEVTSAYLHSSPSLLLFA